MNTRRVRRIVAVLGATALVVAALGAGGLWFSESGRVAHHAPEDAPWLFSSAIDTRVADAFTNQAGDTRPVRDIHVTGWDYPRREAPRWWRAPLAWRAARRQNAATGVRDDAAASQEYTAYLLRQIQAMPGTYAIHLLADVGAHGEDSRPNGTAHAIDNDWALRLADTARVPVQPVPALDPRRPDIVATLDRLARAGSVGVRFVADEGTLDLNAPELARVLEAMAARDLVLYLTVGGATADGASHDWRAPEQANPALVAGLTVVLSLGAPEGADGETLMPGLFSLLDDMPSDTPLFIDLAGQLAPARLRSVLEPLLQHPQHYARLRYGSGYPQAIVDGAIDLDALVEQGFIAADRRGTLARVRAINPLLFVLMTWRAVHLPGTSLGLPDAVFFNGLSS